MRTWMTMAMIVGSVGCSGGGGSTAPTPAASTITVAASPNPIVSAACAGCGAQSTDREAATQLTMQETGGVAASVTAVAMSLRENGTNAVIASGEFDAAAVTQLAGSNRIAANGSLVIRNVGVHYGREQAGRAATLTYTVRIRDDRGNTATRDLAVSVPIT